MHLHQPTTRNQSGFSIVEVLLVVLVVAVLAVTGLVVYQHNKLSSAKSTAAATGSTQTTTQPKTTTTTQPAQNLYAGWKTYTLAEDSTISFKYPSDWTIAGDFKDTSSTPYNRFFKITAPNLYHDNHIVFIFRYSPGNNNQLTQICARGGTYSNIVNSEDVTVGSNKLKIVTTAGSIDAIKTINMALVDDSNCLVTVPSGVIEATENLGSQSAPTYSIDLNTWESLPESNTIDLIFKSFKF
jgi:prepilin-type N-terminal cleavage/methylation domain-containing protein